MFLLKNSLMGYLTYLSSIETSNKRDGTSNNSFVKIISIKPSGSKSNWISKAINSDKMLLSTREQTFLKNYDSFPRLANPSLLVNLSDLLDINEQNWRILASARQPYPYTQPRSWTLVANGKNQVWEKCIPTCKRTSHIRVRPRQRISRPSLKMTTPRGKCIIQSEVILDRIHFPTEELGEEMRRFGVWFLCRETQIVAKSQI